MLEKFEIIVGGKAYQVTIEHGNILIDDGRDTLMHFSVPTDNKTLATIMVACRLGFLHGEKAAASDMECSPLFG